jgi:drug/metabolite transporter (DMT)-like permease
VVLIGYVLAFIGVFSMSCTIVYSRVLWELPPVQILFWSHVFSFPVYLALSLLLATEEMPCMLGIYKFDQWSLIIGQGLIFFVSLFSFVKATGMSKANYVALLMFLAVLYGYFFDVVFFSMPISVHEILGSIAIFFLVVALYYEKEAPPSKSE